MVDLSFWAFGLACFEIKESLFKKMKIIMCFFHPVLV